MRKRLVAGVNAQSFAPDGLRPLTLALHPERLAQVRADFGFGLALESVFENAARFVQPPLAEGDPAEAVLYEWVVRSEADGFFNEFARLRQALLAVGQQIAQRVVAGSRFGPQLDEAAQQALGFRHVARLLGGQGGFVKQVRVIRHLIKRRAQQGERGAGQSLAVQQIAFGQHFGAGV